MFMAIMAGAVFLLPETVWAGALDLGMEYGNSTLLPSTDPRIIIARIIQVVLGFLGVLALALVVYGGFLWMTSQGNPEKIDQAKKVLKNAAIGLLIILTSFGITTFVLNKMLEALGDTPPPSMSPGGSSGGLGAIGSCIVQSVYPAPGQEDVPRNTSIMVTFKEPLDPASICNDANGNGECDGENIIDDGRIRIYKTNDNFSNYLSNVRVDQTSNDQTFVFTPDEYLGSPSEYIWYSVYMSNDVLKSNGDGAFNTCQQNFLEWQFEVSNRLDLDPPEVTTVFPPPDNSQDDTQVVSSLEFASGDILLNNNPEYYEPATSTLVTPQGPASSNVEAEVNPNCEQDGTLRLAVEPDGITATLENISTGNSLGTSQFQGDTVNFPGILSFTVNYPYSSGHFWNIEVEAMRPADSLNVNANTYTFVGGGTIQPNEILVGPNSDSTASNIAARLDGRSDLIASSTGSMVNIRAETAGSDGNNIFLQGNDNNNDGDFTITSMSGGADEEEVVNVNGRRDKPKNAIIQVNFNDAINPVTVSGSAGEVDDYIRIVNAESGASGDGAGCSENSDCLSFDCDDSTNQCVNDYLSGKFLISNRYSTIEFQSDNECGVNACGERIYCLPENANIRVEMVAAELEECTNNCTTRSPYNACESCIDCNDVDETCVDDQDTATTSDDRNYPLSHLPLEGIADAANNSLNGNKVRGAEGPVSYYDENVANTDNGDNYTWSFWTNDELRTEPPEIVGINPDLEETTDNLIDPVEIGFNTLMQSSSLNSGETRIVVEGETTVHKLINIWNFAGSALGYWVTKEGVEDEPPIDGYPNRTRVLLNHSMFADSITYRSQVGSGVKDIYQNCFKPSDGPNCDGMDNNNPTCCNGDVYGSETCP